MTNIRSKIKDNLNIPNVLSLLRIMLLIPLVCFFNINNFVAVIIIFVIMGITDFLDGFIARKCNMITSLGKILDPVADKLLIITVMICVGMKFKLIVPFVYILIIKEVLMLLAGLALIKRKKKLQPSKWYGKLATFSFFVSVSLIVSLKVFFNIANNTLILMLMILTSALMIFAFYKYLLCFLEEIKS